MTIHRCILKGLAAVLLGLILSGCFVWPMKVAYELEVTVVDAKTERPIPGAQVVYLACDVHDFDCSHARLIRTVGDKEGVVDIAGKRRWGIWIPAPGGLPVPDHLVAIWAPGYSAFVHSQYGDSPERRREETLRQDIKEALKAIPAERSSSDESLNPKTQLIGGKIKLRSLADSTSSLQMP